ncbi:hypothetical protein JOF53_008466 [Crossiella equi]|uniref:Uncharacterized protein n=1 Tax=Crossiella equi TaxID=130796 RepID=A0ABS5ASN5_9PSEU|nr:hypothetical protein [Crossiella equi]MBP2479594.1 hypothetical protein [Crossiella equi]
MSALWTTTCVLPPSRAAVAHGGRLSRHERNATELARGVDIR